jgi:hypothetical protein
MQSLIVPYATAWSAWLRNMVHLSEIAWAAPQVIAMRTQRAWQAGPTPGTRDRREFTRMGQEKLEAYAESVSAMGLLWWQAQLSAASSLAAGTWMNPLASFARPRTAALMPMLVARGLHPVHRRVTANVRRLGRSG